MSRSFLTVGAILALLLPAALPARAGSPVEMGLDYLAAQQQPDGGFTNGFSEGSDLNTTCDVVLAIAAAGQDPSAWLSTDGYSPLDYLAAQVAAGSADSVGRQAKIALAWLAVGLDPSAVGGHDLLAELEDAYDEGSGSYDSTLFDQALAMLALFNAGRPVPEGAAQYLLDNQTADGAWALFGGTAPETGDTNTTALVIQALLVTGHKDDIGTAFDYLHRVQNGDGGFPYQSPSEYGTDTDANSTAYVLQALVAAEEPLVNWTPAGVDPIGALEALHDPVSGGFFWQAAVPFPNVLATAQAIPALQGYTFVHLPRTGAANPPQATGISTPLLPETGGEAAFPLTVGVVGLLLAGAGLALYHRRWMRW